MDTKPWDAEYSRLLSKAVGSSASFEGQRSFLAFCRLRAVGSPEHIAAAGASLLDAAGAALRLGFEHDDVLEQTAVAEMQTGKAAAAGPRVEALRRRHPGSQRAGRLQAQLLEASGDRSGAVSALATVLNSNAGHAGALRRRVALAKKKLVLPSSGGAAAAVPASASHLALAGRPAGEAALVEAVKELASLLELSSGDPDAWVEMAELQLALRRPEQASFAYEEAILAAPNHPEFHVRAAEIALHRALALRCPSSSSSSSAAPSAAAGGLLRAAAALAASDASSGAATMAAATAGVGADAGSAGALLRQARLHAAEAVRQTESAGADVDGAGAAASGAAGSAGDAPYANGYALAVLADVCWAHITRVASSLAPAASPPSSAAAAVFAHPPPRLFSVSSAASASASESTMPSLAAIVAAAADDLNAPAGAGAAAAAADAATAAARGSAKEVADLLHAAATADHEVNASILLHRLAAHGLERLAASSCGSASAADAAAAAAAATGPLPFTAVEFAAVRGPYARYVLARDALLAAAGAGKPTA